MADVIKSYLVSLSASVDKQSFDKFSAAMLGAQRTVASNVGGIVGNLLKFQIAGTAAFATVGFGIIGYIDKLAMADLKTKLLATQNMMSVQQYRAVSMALDTLGVTLNDVFFGTKELQERFHILIDDQKKLAGIIGPNYEQQMRQVRDVIFQLQRLELKGEYFGMKFAADLLEKLGFGKGGLELQLEKLNNFVLTNMPAWSDELTTDIIPVLGQMWDIFKRTGDVIKEASIDFDDLISTLSGDSSIDTKKASFESFARSIEHVVFWTGEAIKLMIGLEKVGVHSLASVLDVGKALWALNGSPTQYADAKQHLSDAADQAVGAAHGFENMGEAILPSRLGGDKFQPYSQVTPQGTGTTSDFMRLVQGVAQVESGGQHYDKFGHVKLGPANRTGEFAVGMMQLLPSTAKMLGVDPYDPKQNLEGGEEYLAQLLRAHKGNVEAALAEYGGAKSQYTPSGKDYVRRVEAAAGITVGSIVVNVPQTNATPIELANAVKKGVKNGIDEHTRHLMAELNGAYQ